MKNEISFPSEYKQPLLKRIKNNTVRCKDELGKYKKGEIYHATSPSGKPWGVRIKVVDVKNTFFDKLTIPPRSKASLKRKEKLKKDSKVQLIKFKVMK